MVCQQLQIDQCSLGAEDAWRIEHRAHTAWEQRCSEGTAVFMIKYNIRFNRNSLSILSAFPVNCKLWTKLVLGDKISDAFLHWLQTISASTLAHLSLFQTAIRLKNPLFKLKRGFLDLCNIYWLTDGFIEAMIMEFCAALKRSSKRASISKWKACEKSLAKKQWITTFTMTGLWTLLLY